jgi:uncharacterized membrane protein HdeD (DUF308 family)
MTTSHTTPTPPQPRPGDSQFVQETGAPRAATEMRDQEAAESTMPSWLSGLVNTGLKPWKGMYTLGVVMIILGVLILAWPGATLLVMAILFGCYLVLSGIMGMVEGFSDRHKTTGMRVAYVILGVLGVVLGLYCLRRVDVTVLVLAFLLSVFWIMRGIIDLSAAMASSGVPGNGWLAFSGILSVIAGILVLFWPGITLGVLVIFAGAWLLVYGIMMIYGGYRLHKLAARA